MGTLAQCRLRLAVRTCGMAICECLLLLQARIGGGEKCRNTSTLSGTTGARQIETARLLLRPWRLDDDVAACAIYRAAEVTRWLSPTLPAIGEPAEMRAVLQRWISENDATGLPLGRWAIIDSTSAEVIGGVALLPLPPGCTDLEIGWQIAPERWGQGFGAKRPAMRSPTRLSKTQELVRYSPSCGRAICAV